MLVRPIGMKPAARSRATLGASCVAGGASRKTTEPAVVTSPAMSNRSLIDTGMPANGDGAWPLRAQAVVEIGRRQRRFSVHLEKDAAAFAGRVVDARQALLDQRAAFRAVPQAASRCRRCLRNMMAALP